MSTQKTDRNWGSKQRRKENAKARRAAWERKATPLQIAQRNYDQSLASGYQEGVEKYGAEIRRLKQEAR